MGAHVIPLVWSDHTLNWVNFGLAVGGIAVSVVGFIVAIYTIKKTQGADEATQDTATSGTLRIRYNQLIILAPQLASMEQEMDAAVSRHDRFAAERVLVRWRQTATQAEGILREIDSKYVELADQIRRTCAAARNAKARLPEAAEGTDKTVASVTSAVRKDLAAASDELSAVVSNLSTEVKGGATNG